MSEIISRLWLNEKFGGRSERPNHMPSVRRQSPDPQDGLVQQNSPTGSMLSRVISAQQLTNDCIKMIIYGQNRVGKTTIACQFPKPLLLIALEPNQTGGANSIKRIDGVDVIAIGKAVYEQGPNGKQIKVTVAEQVRRLSSELKQDTHYKTHVIDSVTALNEWVLVEIKGWDEPQLQKVYDTRGDQGVDAADYRLRSEEVRKILWPLLTLPVHTVCTAKERDHNPPKEEKFSAAGKPIPDMRPRFLRGMQQESFFAADVGGATVGWLHDVCDYIGRLYFAKEVERTAPTYTEVNGQKIPIGGGERETGRFVRCLRTLYHPNYAAGFRSSTPERVPEYIENPTYEKIRDVIDGTYKE